MAVNCEAISKRILIKHFPNYFSLDSVDHDAYKQNVIQVELPDIEKEILFYLRKYHGNEINSQTKQYYINWVTQYLIGVGNNNLTLNDVTCFDSDVILKYKTLYDFNRSSLSTFESLIIENSEDVLSFDIIDIWGRAIINSQLHYINIQSVSKTILADVELHTNYIIDQKYSLGDVNRDIFDKIKRIQLEKLGYFNDLNKITDYHMERMEEVNGRFQSLSPFVMKIEHNFIHPEITLLFSNNEALKNTSIDNFWEDCSKLINPHKESIVDWLTIYEKQKADMWILDNL